jgi:poly(ADP-ribose) glycohydrolase ARH3
MEIPQGRFVGCLLGLTTGDSLGAPFEGIPAETVYYTDGPIHELLAHPSSKTLRYTDDTQMMIGVAETILEKGEIEPGLLAQKFAENYQPKRGYGRGARAILEAIRDGGDWNQLAESLFPGGSFGNGAAMRVAPVGITFASDLNRVQEQAKLSAWPTHRHSLGIEGAVLLALGIALAAKGPPLDRGAFYDTLESFCSTEEFRWQLRAARKLRRGHSLAFLGNGLPAHRSVVTSIACFTTSPDSFEGAIEQAIIQGDDTDTLAAMAGALCGAHLGIAAIPSHWLERMEETPKGASYIQSLAERLSNLKR